MEALGIIEGQSLTRGLKAIDACLKKATLEYSSLRFLSPGKFVLCIGGRVAEVEESFQDGVHTLGDKLIDAVKVLDPHPSLIKSLAALENQTGVLHALTDIKDQKDQPAVGLFEWTGIGGAFAAIDQALKGMRIELGYIRVGKGIGGKTVCIFYGDLAEIESAFLEIQARSNSLNDGQIIARPDPLWLEQVTSWLETPF